MQDFRPQDIGLDSKWLAQQGGLVINKIWNNIYGIAYLVIGNEFHFQAAEFL
jgi:hypothetical protein